jgi:hypothetical protein
MAGRPILVAVLAAGAPLSVPHQGLAGGRVDEMKPGARGASDGFIGPRLVLLLMQHSLHVHTGLGTSEDDQRGHLSMISDKRRFVLTYVKPRR